MRSSQILKNHPQSYAYLEGFTAKPCVIPKLRILQLKSHSYISTTCQELQILLHSFDSHCIRLSLKPIYQNILIHIVPFLAVILKISGF